MKLSWDNFDFKNGLFILLFHLAFLIAVPWYFIVASPSAGLVIATIILAVVCGLSITAGYHRLYSHKAFKTNAFVESVVLYFSTLCIQGSAIQWSHDHREHHNHVDTDRDPYSVKKGFWFAHWLWILQKPLPFDPKIVQDLQRNKLLAFQHKYFITLVTLTNASIVLLFGWLYNDYFGAFAIGVLARLFFTYHTTWFINSLAHFWGSQPFSKEHTAVNNYIISLLTHGEGYHNFHHTFEYDYRNGVHWWQWDPTKMIIWTLHKLGLAKGLRRADQFTIKQKLLLEDKRMLLDKIKMINKSDWVTFEEKVVSMSDSLSLKLSDVKELISDYKKLKKEKSKKENLKKARWQIKALKKHIKLDYQKWGKLCDYILKYKTVKRPAVISS